MQSELSFMQFDKLQLHCAAEGRLRGLAIQNFLDMVGFCKLVEAILKFLAINDPKFAHTDQEKLLYSILAKPGGSGLPLKFTKNVKRKF